MLQKIVECIRQGTTKIGVGQIKVGQSFIRPIPDHLVVPVKSRVLICKIDNALTSYFINPIPQLFQRVNQRQVFTINIRSFKIFIDDTWVFN